MDYRKHYKLLIERARDRLLESYIECHHIIPTCMNGSNDAGNLVNLTAEEHYVAHQLLVKIYPENKKLLHAAGMMTLDRHGHRVNNKMYGWLRRKISTELSESKLGVKLGPMSEETKRKISKANKGKPSIITDATKKKIGAANRGRKLPLRTDTHKKRLSEAAQRRPKQQHTEESKRKISEARKRYEAQKKSAQ